LQTAVFVVRNNAVQCRSNVKWNRLMWVTLLVKLGGQRLLGSCIAVPITKWYRSQY